MNKIILTLCVLYAVVVANAQQASISHNNDDRIASILAKMPAKNAGQLNANVKEIAGLGEQGLVNLITMLSAAGQGDNTKIKEAVSGLSFYVTQKGNEVWRKMSVRAYVKALHKVDDRENKAFIISQLQIAGKDDAVASLQRYLTDSQLCDPAARALIEINSPFAKKVLLEALPGSTGRCQLSLIEALGDSRNTSAVKSIAALIGKDQNLDKIALYALANIADLSSVKILTDAAQKSGFTYDATNATSSYLLYIKNLSKYGKSQDAIKIGKTLLTKAGLAKQLHTRTAALKLLVDIQGVKSMPMLIIAAGNTDPKYSAAALKFASPYITPITTTAWLKELNKANPQEKAGIVTLLGDNSAQSALPAIIKELESTDNRVRQAAITAAGKLGQNKVLDNLFVVLKTGNAEDIQTIKNTLLVMKGNIVASKVAQVLPTMPADAQAPLIDFLASRRYHSSLDAVTPLLRSENGNVRTAAFSSLKHIADESDLPELFSLLNVTDLTDDLSSIQNAIIAVIGHSKNKSQNSELVLQQLDKAKADKKLWYFNILASVGDKRSLNAIIKAFNEGDERIKKTALVALSQWSNGSASEELYRISKDASDDVLQNLAIQGYVDVIIKSAYKPERRFIFLRNAMDIARTVEQKRFILKEIGNIKTYPALMYAGKYLEDASLQGEASNDVINIALSNKAFYGNDVRQLLTKTIQVMKGTDSDYLKEAIRKFISEMPIDDGFVLLFNGRDLSGWKGLVADPVKRAKMDTRSLAAEQQKADGVMRKGWYVKDNILNFSGEGENICTIKQYGNMEMFVDWKISKDGDAGIYLRGSPQVQIWDTSRVSVGAQVGSGGLYNNKVHQSKPLMLADNAIEEWNNFHILMIGDKVTVYLNGEMVVDNIVMDNYWDSSIPIFSKEQIELQAHGTHVYYRDIYLRELPELQ